MKLHSIHVGKSIEVKFNENTISTGIYKNQIDGPVYVSKLNINGDEQADLTVHGGVNKAVYAYPMEHYKFWEEKRADLSFEPGIFGENLSISGLSEETVLIGDQYQIGEVVFQVTTPRLPCFKLGIKMNDTRFIKDFMMANRTGFYFKVLKEGTLQEEDKIIHLKGPILNLSVKEVVSLYSEEKDNQDLLKKAVSSPDLPADWIQHFEEKLAGLN